MLNSKTAMYCSEIDMSGIQYFYKNNTISIYF